MQLSDIQSAYALYKQDISDVSSGLFIQWCNYIMWYLFRNLIQTDPSKFLKTVTLNVQNGVSKYALPADFDSMKVYGTGVFSSDSQGNPTENQIPQTGYGFSAPGYYILNGYIYITPVPVKNDVFFLRYAPQPPTFTSISDYFTSDATITGEKIVPDYYQEYLIRAIDCQYGAWDEDAGAESLSDVRFIRVMDDLLNRIRSTPNVYLDEGMMLNF